MADEQNDESGFKVVDRRSFTSAGKVREESREETPRTETPPDAPGTAPAPARQEPVEDFETEPSSFETLVSYLSTTAMFQMGLIAGPGGERIPPDMRNARRTVDLLDVLQQKTQGNLTEEEAQLLEDVLYELRVAFVEMGKRQTRKTP